MKEVDVLFFVEHVARELDIACAVKYICETAYHLRVEIVSLPYEICKAVHRYQPNVAVTPYLYGKDDDPSIANFIRHWKNVNYLNLNFEQVLSKINRAFKIPQDNFVKNSVYQYSWSTPFKNYLVQNGVREENVFIGGNPTFVLYQKPYSDFYPSRSKLSKKFKIHNDKRWLLFPENYAWAFFPDSWIEGRIRRGFNSKIAYERRAFEKKSLIEAVRWLGWVARHSNLEIIIRPRPAVAREKWEDICKTVLSKIPPSMHIIKDGSVREWILASDIVMSSQSTTLLEAVVARKPAFILEPYKFPDWLIAEWFDNIPHITTRDLLHSTCLNVTNAEFPESFRENLITSYLGSNDPIHNIARILYHLRCNGNSPTYIPEDSNSRWVQTCSKLLEQPFTKLPKRAIGKVTQIIHKTQYKASFEYDHISNRDVSRRIKKWRKTLVAEKRS